MFTIDILIVFVYLFSIQHYIYILFIYLFIQEETIEGISLLLHQALDSCVLLERYPKAIFEVCFLLIEDDGGNYNKYIIRLCICTELFMSLIIIIIIIVIIIVIMNKHKQKRQKKMKKRQRQKE